MFLLATPKPQTQNTVVNHYPYYGLSTSDDFITTSHRVLLIIIHFLKYIIIYYIRNSNTYFEKNLLLVIRYIYLNTIILCII